MTFELIPPKGATVVVDRGMAFDDNLKQIKSRGYHYIVAIRQGERNKYLDDFEDGEGSRDSGEAGGAVTQGFAETGWTNRKWEAQKRVRCPLYQTLGILAEIMKPVKTWTRKS